MLFICCSLMAIIAALLLLLYGVIQSTKGVVSVMGTLAAQLSGQLEQIQNQLKELDRKYTVVNKADGPRRL